MPLEIREMHIKAIIDDSSKPSEGHSVVQEIAGSEEMDMEDIISQVIDVVMELLEDKKER